MKTCKWEGDIEDYIVHVASVHPENYYEIREYGTFRWKLPHHNDQQDIGIIRESNRYFLFEMFYSNSLNILYFHLHNIAMEPSKYRYAYYLSETTIKQSQATVNHNELQKPVNQRSTIIQLHKSELSSFLDCYNHFTWKVKINSPSRYSSRTSM